MTIEVPGRYEFWIERPFTKNDINVTITPCEEDETTQQEYSRVMEGLRKKLGLQQ